MVKLKQNDGTVGLLDEPASGLVVSREAELRRIREARNLLAGLNQSIWSGDVLTDLERWEREVQAKRQHK